MNTPLAATAEWVDVLTAIFYVAACVCMLLTIWELIKWGRDT